MTIERLPDPATSPELWEPAQGTVRIDFETSRLMSQAGIPSDMTEDANSRYLRLLDELAAEVAPTAHVRATGYRTGPAAGGDFAFIDLVLKVSDLAQTALMIATVIRWLRQHGALETRVANWGIEMLARWELQRRGEDPQSALLALSLTPSEGMMVHGAPRQHGGFVVVFRLSPQRLATITYSLDGDIREYSEGEGGERRNGNTDAD